MKKVKCIKEMPFCEVGDIVKEFDGGFNFTSMGNTDGFRYNEWWIKKWIQDGWLEWVEEEKSLEEKIGNYIDTNPTLTKESMVLKTAQEELAQIAHTHFLSLFDKAVENNDLPSVYKRTNLKVIREVLEEGR